jgi:hypothetical protein
MTSDRPAYRVVPVRRGTQSLEWTARILALCWGGFWTWFSLAEAFSDVPGGWSHVLFPLLLVVALVILAWRTPRWGGALFVAAGVTAAVMFRDPWVWALLAAPPIVIGAMFALSTRRPA